MRTLHAPTPAAETRRLRGNITSGPYAERAKEYAWHLCLRHAPRKITPTDIDYFVERNGRFLFFEMKTEGAKVPYGQHLALARLLLSLGGKAILAVVEHAPLDRVEMPGDVLRFTLWAKDGLRVVDRGPFPGEAFIPFYVAFFEWATGDDDAIRRALHPFTATPESGMPEAA